MNAPFSSPVLGQPILTAERAREVLSYDPESGVLTWRVSRPGTSAGTVAGTFCEGYLQVQIDYRFYRAHRVIWLMVTGEWPTHNVDHRNRKRADNRWLNLREATPLQNARNKSPSRANTSGVVGVSRAGRKWGAYIGLDNRIIHLGCFEAKDDAVEARCRAEQHYFGEFAATVSASREGRP